MAHLLLLYRSIPGLMEKASELLMLIRNNANSIDHNYAHATFYPLVVAVDRLEKTDPNIM